MIHTYTIQYIKIFCVSSYLRPNFRVQLVCVRSINRSSSRPLLSPAFPFPRTLSPHPFSFLLPFLFPTPRFPYPRNPAYGFGVSLRVPQWVRALNTFCVLDEIEWIWWHGRYLLHANKNSSLLFLDHFTDKLRLPTVGCQPYHSMYAVTLLYRFH